MKIMYICETVDYGVGQNIRDLVELGLSNEHEIHLVWSHKRTGDSYIDWIVKLEASNSLFFQYMIPMKRSPGFSDLLVIYRVLKVCWAIPGLKIIHGFSSKGGAIARIAGRLRSIPAFYSPHAYIISDPAIGASKKKFYFFVEKLLNSRAYVVCTSAEEVEITKNLGCQNFRFIPNGIELPKKSEQLELSRGFAISFVGRFSEQKNPKYFLQIVKILAHLEVDFNMFGDGPLAQEVAALVSENGLEGRVKIWGRVAIGEIWRNTDILLCTSNYEGFPYTFIQALSHGIPVISTQVGGTESIVVDAETGLIFDLKTTDAVIYFVEKFIRLDSFRRFVTDQCILKSKEFDRETMYSNTLDFYLGALKV